MGLTVFNDRKTDTTKQPMFFGAPLGMQRYDEYKYPDFDRLTQSQLGFFWRPEEVSLQKDRPIIKHSTSNRSTSILLISSIKFSSTLQGRGPGMAFAPYCSLPELEGCIGVWNFMEQIHSRSYTHIIKNVYADPSEVFDTVLDDEDSRTCQVSMQSIQ